MVKLAIGGTSQYPQWTPKYNTVHHKFTFSQHTNQFLSANGNCVNSIIVHEISFIRSHSFIYSIHAFFALHCNALYSIVDALIRLLFRNNTTFKSKTKVRFTNIHLEPLNLRAKRFFAPKILSLIFVCRKKMRVQIIIWLILGQKVYTSMWTFFHERSSAFFRPHLEWSIFIILVFS